MTERDDGPLRGGSGFPGGSSSPGSPGAPGDGPEGAGASGGGRDPWSPSPDQAPSGPGEAGPGPGAVPGPGPGYGPGYGYGAPQPPAGTAGSGYGYPVRQTSSNAVAALVLAIASYVICPIIFAIVALILARTADREIAASGGLKEGAGMARAARIISWINIVLVGLVIAFAVLAAALGLAGAFFSGPSFGR